MPHVQAGESVQTGEKPHMPHMQTGEKPYMQTGVKPHMQTGEPRPRSCSPENSDSYAHTPDLSHGVTHGHSDEEESQSVSEHLSMSDSDVLDDSYVDSDVDGLDSASGSIATASYVLDDSCASCDVDAHTEEKQSGAQDSTASDEPRFLSLRETRTSFQSWKMQVTSYLSEMIGFDQLLGDCLWYDARRRVCSDIDSLALAALIGQVEHFSRLYGVISNAKPANASVMWNFIYSLHAAD